MVEIACRKIEVEDIIACSLSIKKSEYKIFEVMLKHNDVMTIKTLSDKLGLDRTTIQKVLKKFVDTKLVQRYQENLDNGGYVFVYKVKDKLTIRKHLHELIDKWHDAARHAVDKW